MARRRLLPCRRPDSLPDLKTSWENLMWNLEFDDDDLEGQELVRSARSAVMAALAEVSLDRDTRAAIIRPSASLIGVSRVWYRVVAPS